MLFAPANWELERGLTDSLLSVVWVFLLVIGSVGLLGRL